MYSASIRSIAVTTFHLANQGAARELYPSRRAVHHPESIIGIQTRKFISACGRLGKEARQTRKLPRPFHSGLPEHFVRSASTMTCIPLTMIPMFADSAAGSEPPPPTTPAFGSEVAFISKALPWVSMRTTSIPVMAGTNSYLPARASDSPKLSDTDSNSMISRVLSPAP